MCILPSLTDGAMLNRANSTSGILFTRLDCCHISVSDFLVIAWRTILDFSSASLSAQNIRVERMRQNRNRMPRLEREFHRLPASPQAARERQAGKSIGLDVLYLLSSEGLDALDAPQCAELRRAGRTRRTVICYERGRTRTVIC